MQLFGLGLSTKMLLSIRFERSIAFFGESRQKFPTIKCFLSRAVYRVPSTVYQTK